MAIAVDQLDFATAEESHVELLVPPPDSVPPLQTVRRSRKKWAKWAWVVGLIILLGVSVELWRTHTQNAVGYDTVAVERGLIQASVTATGTLNAVVDVQVGSQVSGNIKALYADFNTKVTKGQLVALIDPAPFQAQVDQAQASLSSAHAATLT